MDGIYKIGSSRQSKKVLQLLITFSWVYFYSSHMYFTLLLFYSVNIDRSTEEIVTFCYFMQHCPWKIHFFVWREVHFLLKWAVLHLNPQPYRKVTACKTNKREDKGETILHYAPLTSFPPFAFSFPSSPATFICCPINNCYCSFNYAPVISKSGGHVSSPSQGSLGNYQHPSKGRCSCSSVAVAIITLPPLTSVPWARSPSGLSLSHHASLCQAWPLTPPMAPRG